MWTRVQLYHNRLSDNVRLTKLVLGSLSVGQFLAGLRKWKQTLDPEPSKWTFGALKRTPDGQFHDSDLVKLLQDGAEHAAGWFKSSRCSKLSS